MNKPSKEIYEEDDGWERPRTFSHHAQETRIRVLNYCLLQATGIPKDISSLKLLHMPQYFKRYGSVTHISTNQKNASETGLISAYVTYEDEFSAALALLALNGSYVCGKQIKVLYGTNRYCQALLKKQNCNNSYCIFLHAYNRVNELNMSKHTPEYHNSRAIRVVNENLKQLGERQRSQLKNTSDLKQFPSVSETVNFLLKNSHIPSNFIEEHVKKIQKKATEKFVIIRRPANYGLSKIQEPPLHEQPIQQEKASENQEMGSSKVVLNILAEINRKRFKSRLEFKQQSMKQDLLGSSTKFDKEAEEVRSKIKSFLLTRE